MRKNGKTTRLAPTSPYQSQLTDILFWRQFLKRGPSNLKIDSKCRPYIKRERSPLFWTSLPQTIVRAVRHTEAPQFIPARLFTRRCPAIFLPLSEEPGNIFQNARRRKEEDRPEDASSPFTLISRLSDHQQSAFRGKELEIGGRDKLI